MPRGNPKPRPKSVISWDMGTRNLSYCYVSIPDIVYSWGMIDLNTNTPSMCTQRLFEILESDKYQWMKSTDADVVIESQPRAGAPKSLSYALQMYFLCHYKPDGKTRKVSFMAPNSKLKLFANLYDTHPHEKYSQRKQLAIIAAKHVLNNGHVGNQAYLEWFNDHGFKEQTDLADSLVQGCRYLQLKNKMGELNVPVEELGEPIGEPEFISDESL